MLVRMQALAGAVQAYAQDFHQLSWAEDDAIEALARLSEDFGTDLALARRRGKVAEADFGEDRNLAVVHGFARHAFERDPTNFGYLEEMVQGTMLVNAVYFKDIGHVSNKLPDMHVYLDTTPVLRILGLADDHVSAATRELLDLLHRDFRVPTFVFPHTLDEIAGVLDGVAGGLRRGTKGAVEQGTVSGRNREAIDALMRRGATAGEIEGLRADLETKLAELHIHVRETPPHLEKGHLDEARFDEILDDVVAYRSKGPKEKDLRSLAAVDRLRGNDRPRDLSSTTALFITANPYLVKASWTFFNEADRAAPVAHAMHETDFTAQLWVRSPHPLPDLPRKRLIADCYAALNPGPDLWERWVQHIVRLEERGDISQEQLQNLIYHQQAKSKLFEVTHGDANAVGDDTVAEVLERFEAALRQSGEEEAAAERARRVQAEEAARGVEGERDSLRGQVEELARWKETRETRALTWRTRLSKARTAAGYFGLAASCLAFVLLCLVWQVVDTKLAWATAVTLLVLIGSSSWAWATRKSWKFPLSAVIFAGALTALFVNVFSIVPEEPPDPPTGQQGQRE